MQGSPAASRNIPSLDGLRAVSIAFVLFEHFSVMRGFPIGIETVHERIGELGSLGVRVFFVISGFLITSLLLEERRKTGRISLGGFYMRRAFRIFPAAYVFIGVVFLCATFGLIQVLPGDFLHSATYTMNFHRPKSYWLVHLWSLSVEEQFYFLWPAVVLLAGVRGAGWFAFGQIALAPIIRLVIWFKFPAYRDFQQFWAVMDSIAAGCLLAVWQPKLERLTSVVALLRTRWFYLVPVAVLGTMWVSQRSFAAYMAHDTLMNLGIAVCVWRFVTQPGDLGGRILNYGPVRYVGTLSYSIYLWQQLFVSRDSRGWIQQFPMNLAAICLIALASFYLVEQPMLRLRARLARRAAAKVAPQASIGPSVSV